MKELPLQTLWAVFFCMGVLALPSTAAAQTQSSSRGRDAAREARSAARQTRNDLRRSAQQGEKLDADTAEQDSDALRRQGRDAIRRIRAMSRDIRRESRRLRRDAIRARRDSRLRREKSQYRDALENARRLRNDFRRTSRESRMRGRQDTGTQRDRLRDLQKDMWNTRLRAKQAWSQGDGGAQQVGRKPEAGGGEDPNLTTLAHAGGESGERARADFAGASLDSALTPSRPWSENDEEAFVEYSGEQPSVDRPSRSPDFDTRPRRADRYEGDGLPPRI